MYIKKMCVYVHIHAFCQEHAEEMQLFHFCDCHVFGSVEDRITRMTGFGTRRVKVDQCLNTRLLGGLASPRCVHQDRMAWNIFICGFVFSSHMRPAMSDVFVSFLDVCFHGKAPWKAIIL